MAEKYANLLITDTTRNWNGSGMWFLADRVTPTTDPTSGDDVVFDNLTFLAAGQSVVVNSTASCLNMDWTGATNNPTLAVNNKLITNGTVVTFIAAMTMTGANILYFNAGVTTTFTTNGLVLTCSIDRSGSSAGIVNQTDDLTCSELAWEIGTWNTNNHQITANGLGILIPATSGSMTVTLGSSVVNIALWNYTGSNLTLTANTSTINVTGTGAGAFGNANYNGASFNFNGTAHTLSGNPTGILAIGTPPATTQTLSITAGNRITATTMTLSGNATHQHTIQSGTAGTLASIWATNKTDAFVTYTDMLRNYNGVIVADCSGAGGGTFSGAGGTFTSITVQGAGAYALTITGNNAFGILTVDISHANKSIITTGTTQTIGDLRYIQSGTYTASITGGTWTKAGGGSIFLDYAVVTNLTANPAVWYAGVNSTNGGGNSGITFNAPNPSRLVGNIAPMMGAMKLGIY